MSAPASLPADLTLDDIWHMKPAAPSANSNSATGRPTARDAAGEASSIEGAWGADGFTFADLLDLINPLQHIPVVSTIYREVTGDEIAPAAKFIGSTLLGGVPGLAVATLNSVLEDTTGMDIGEMAMAALTAEDGATATTSIASAADKPPARLAAAAQMPLTPQNAAATGADENAVAAAQMMNFFTPRVSGTAAPIPGPGAIQNKMFRPQASLQMAALQSAAAPAAASAAPLPPEQRPAIKPPLAPSNTSDKMSAEDAKRVAANRAALLSLAQDLRGMIQGKDADTALAGGGIKPE
jgi:hypothetical protein